MYTWGIILNTNETELNIKGFVGAYMEYTCGLSPFAYWEV